MTSNLMIAITSANNYEYTVKCIESIPDKYKSSIRIYDDASTEPIAEYCKKNKIPFCGYGEPKGVTALWNWAHRDFISRPGLTHLLMTNNDVIFSKDSIDNLLDDMINSEAIIIGPLTNKPGSNRIQNILNYSQIDILNDTTEYIDKVHTDFEEKERYQYIPMVNGFCFLVDRRILNYANSIDNLIPPHLINVGNEDWLCSEIRMSGERKIAISLSSYVFHYKAVTTRHCTNSDRNTLWRKNKYPYFKTRSKSVKGTVLCTAHTAMGLGDGVMMSSTILDLAKQYNVRLITTESAYNVLKCLDNGKDIRLFNMNDQGHFYTNDHIRAFNLIYWETQNALRQLPHQALNMIRKNADLEIYKKEYQLELPELPIDNKSMDQMARFVKSLPKPVILIQPFVSYWNKMIDSPKYHAIINKLRTLGGSIIQIGGPVGDHMIHKDVINYVGKTSLEQSLALLKCADVLVSGDSFLQHAAAHLKTPTVVMWCGTNPSDFGYPFFTNIHYPDIVTCQSKCGRPMRWIYDYDYKNKNEWNSRSETGWICPIKLCERVISIDDVFNGVQKEISLGRNRDWSFYDIVR